MSAKTVSPFAPDQWIRTLNQRYPNLWTDLRKSYEDPREILKPGARGLQMLENIPDWCILPTMFPCLLLSVRHGDLFYMTHMDEVMTMASMYTWRCSRGVYRFAPEIYQALISQPITGNLPMDVLHHLPEWAVYIETPGLTYERREMKGFIAHLDYNLFSQGTDLQFAMFLAGTENPKTLALPFGNGSVQDAMSRVDAVDDMFSSRGTGRYVGGRDEYLKTLTAMLQLLLYLCSDEPDLPVIEHPIHRRTLSGTVRGPREPRVWNVGVRISNVIRKYRESTPIANSSADPPAAPGNHASPRPHIRSAHWHTYWTGPRDAQFPQRKPIVKWIPPIPVGVDWKAELPTSVKNVVG